MTRYVFTVFTNDSDAEMHVYTSADATTFTPLRCPAYKPSGTLIRDPSIIRHTDGRYYVAYTTNHQDDRFGIASSADLMTWDFHTHVPVPVDGVRNVWAPEWFVEPDGGEVSVIVSVGTNGVDFRPLRLAALDGSLTAFGDPVPLAGIAPNYIDTFVVKADGTYHAFVKQETTKYIEHALAPALTGPYTFVGTGDWAGWGDWLEGQALVRLDHGGWRIFLDGYDAHRYYYADSPDLYSWSALAELPGGVSGVIRHGTILREPDASGGPATSE